MTKGKYRERRKERFKKREERFKKTIERIKDQKKALRRRKWAEAARRKKIREKLLPTEIVEREKGTEALTAMHAAIKEIEEETKVSPFTPEVVKRIDEMVKDAEKKYQLAEFEKTIKLTSQIRELVKRAKSEALRKAEEKKKRRKDEARYFYCLIPDNQEKSFGDIGILKNEVYTIPHRDLAAVVSDSPIMDYEMVESNMREHEAVLRQLMDKHTVVPVEFGTVIKNERILRRLMKKAYGPAKECLKLVDNMVELGVKAVLDNDIVFAGPEKRKECVSDILVSLNTKAKQAITGDLFSDRLILNASFLVSKEGIDEFSNKVTKLQEKYPMLKLMYSGPWAPYNFVCIRIGAKGLEVAKK